MMYSRRGGGVRVPEKGKGQKKGIRGLAGVFVSDLVIYSVWRTVT